MWTIIAAVMFGVLAMQPIAIEPEPGPAPEPTTVDVWVPMTPAAPDPEMGGLVNKAHVPDDVFWTPVGRVTVDEDPDSATYGHALNRFVCVTVYETDLKLITERVPIENVPKEDIALHAVGLGAEDYLISKRRHRPMEVRAGLWRKHVEATLGPMTKLEQATFLDYLNKNKQMDDELTLKIAEELDIADIEIEARAPAETP